MRKLSTILPLAFILGLIFFFARGLDLDPKALNSPLMNKRAPNFRLATVENSTEYVGSEIFKGKVTVLKVWTSSCWICQQEQAFMIEAAKTIADVQWLGLNYKDEALLAKNWLADFGNPYQANLHDVKGQMGLDYGVYGSPETFIIDKQGFLRYKTVGALTVEKWQQEIRPLLIELMDKQP